MMVRARAHPSCLQSPCGRWGQGRPRGAPTRRRPSRTHGTRFDSRFVDPSCSISALLVELLDVCNHRQAADELGDQPYFTSLSAPLVAQSAALAARSLTLAHFEVKPMPALLVMF